MQFDLLEIQGRGKYWWTRTGNYWIDRDNGDRVLPGPNVVVLASADVDHFGQLDHSKTDLLQPDSRMGWLSPDGRFFGCESHCHDLVARLIIRVAVDNLEKSGWCRVQNKLVICREPTIPQRNWAFDNNREFDEL